MSEEEFNKIRDSLSTMYNFLDRMLTEKNK